MLPATRMILAGSDFGACGSGGGNCGNAHASAAPICASGDSPPTGAWVATTGNTQHRRVVVMSVVHFLPSIRMSFPLPVEKLHDASACAGATGPKDGRPGS